MSEKIKINLKNFDFEKDDLIAEPQRTQRHYDLCAFAIVKSPFKLKCFQTSVKYFSNSISKFSG